MVRSAATQIAGKIPPILFVIVIPLLLVTASVTWAVNDLRLYSHEFDKYDIELVTGIDRDGLMAAARQIRGYFNSTEEPLEIRAEIFGEERDLFNEREVLHMRDVKRLIWGVYAVGGAAAVYLLGFMFAGFMLRRHRLATTLAGYVLRGGGLTLALVVLVGLLALTGFDSLFLFFHEASFSNDLWRLDPRTDHLVMMFPQRFWFDATMFVAMATVGLALALGALSGGYLAWQWRQRRRQAPPMRQPSEATGF